MIHSIFLRKRAVISSVVLSIGIGFSGVAQNVSQRKVLDLNLARATEPAVRVVGGSGNGGAVGGPGILVNPIRLSLTHTDKSRCQGGELEMQLEITNTTNQTMLLPWNPDGETVVTPRRLPAFSYRQLSVSAFDDRTNAHWSAASLFGTPLSAGSEATFKPGESALLRGIRIQAASGDLCASELRAVVTLYADELLKDAGDTYRLRSLQLWKVEAH